MTTEQRMRRVIPLEVKAYNSHNYKISSLHIYGTSNGIMARQIRILGQRYWLGF